MIDRQKVYEKFNGHCAYCGKVITIKEMQVDHIAPKRWAHAQKAIGRYPDIPLYKELETMKNGVDDIENLNPSCRRCNHYKRAETLKTFRRMIGSLHERIRKNYICKVAEDYGIIEVKEWDGKFYFEREEEK